MSIDISQFLETFYEESYEGLDVMESELLNLDVGEADSETINTIFRAAHSIKGGSGTFGLTAVADYTHVMETLLDEMRGGSRPVTQPAVELLLESVDVLREMLTALQSGDELDHARVSTSNKALHELLSADNAAAISGDEENTKSTSTQPISGWKIFFKPDIDMLKTGNDPLRIIRELGMLGDMQVECDASALPDIDSLDPEQSYLAWNITLGGDIKEESIKECFEWVEDECELNITAIEEAITQTTTPQAVADVDDRREGDRRQTERRKKTSTESTSIRVNIDKVDDLINMVGELVITQSMLSQVSDVDDFDTPTLERLQDGLTQLEQHTRELQESVMRIRMMPISFAFQRFPRLVHDLSSQFGKQIELKMVGESTELDKTVMEKIGDPLVHLVRNSLDHGIEMPEQRVEAGKPETGIIELNAYHQGGSIVIEIKDDGAGLNTEKIRDKAVENGVIRETDVLTTEQLHDLIFAPGFSTADVISDVSGRGVGMDVVRRNIRALGGTVDVKSEANVGSIFTIRLPLTLAILDGQLVRIGHETYIVPLISIIESLQVKSELINGVTGAAEVYKLREEYIPIARVYQMFNTIHDSETLDNGLLVVVESEGKKIALFVDELLGQQQVVIKSLESNFRHVEGLSGATILGDGTVALILDIAGVMELYQRQAKGEIPKVTAGKTIAA